MADPYRALPELVPPPSAGIEMYWAYEQLQKYRDAIDLVLQGLDPIEAAIVGLEANRLMSIDSGPYGWRDLSSEMIIRGTGSNNPAFSVFRDGLSAYEFSASQVKEVWARFHLQHDYRPGSEVFPHIHFAVGNSAASGIVRWGIEYSLAKGHQQGIGSVFGASTITYVEVPIDANSNYEHHVAEVALGILSAQLEPDSLVFCRFFRDAAHANDTFPASVWVLFVDMHYQYDRYGTLLRAPNFYGP